MNSGKNQRKRISGSIQTFVIRFFAPAWMVFISSSFFRTSSLGFWDAIYDHFFLLMIYFSMTSFVIYLALRLRNVFLEQDFLVVVNFRGEISIPLEKIKKVYEPGYSRSHIIALEIEPEQNLPKKVLFLPDGLDFSFEEHSTAKWLRKLVERRKRELQPTSSLSKPE